MKEVKGKSDKGLVGRVYGNLTVLDYAGEYSQGDLWLCKCVCGNEVVFRRNALIHSCIRDCGCISFYRYIGDTSKLNIGGKRFGNLVALAVYGFKGKDVYWLCRCDCGKEISVPYPSLVGGNVHDCGCLQKPREKIQVKKREKKQEKKQDRRQAKKQNRKQVTPSQLRLKSKLYSKWGSIKHSSSAGVCEEWKDYSAFHEWSLANGYAEGEKMYLRRKDTSEAFSPSNCEWIAYEGDVPEGYAGAEPIKMTYNGLTLTLSDWARMLGVPKRPFYERLYRNGRDIAKACKNPIRGKQIDLDAIVDAEKRRLASMRVIISETSPE